MNKNGSFKDIYEHILTLQRVLQLRACLQKVVIALHVFLGLLRRGRAHSLAVPGEDWLDSGPVRPSHPTPPWIHLTTSYEQVPTEAWLQLRAATHASGLPKSPWTGASASKRLSAGGNGIRKCLWQTAWCSRQWHCNITSQLTKTTNTHLGRAERMRSCPKSESD